MTVAQPLPTVPDPRHDEQTGYRCVRCGLTRTTRPHLACVVMPASICFAGATDLLFWINRTKENRHGLTKDDPHLRSRRVQAGQPLRRHLASQGTAIQGVLRDA